MSAIYQVVFSSSSVPKRYPHWALDENPPYENGRQYPDQTMALTLMTLAFHAVFPIKRLAAPFSMVNHASFGGFLLSVSLRRIAVV